MAVLGVRAYGDEPPCILALLRIGAGMMTVALQHGRITLHDKVE